VDTTRFDEITVGLAQSPSRRGVLRLLGAATFGAGGLAFLADAEAKKRRKKKKKKKATCNDGKKNGSETDVDCGGRCKRCSVGKTCSTRDDCTTALCVGGVCKEPENQAECGLDSDGSNCATRDSAAGERICTKFDGTPFPDGTCESRCKGEEQCIILPEGGGIECVLPCGA
jgi:hypothetical protein